MTRTTRKVIAFIVCTAFVVIVLGLLGWATAGFRNWDSATWFDNWGKGKATKIADNPIESRTMVMTSANAGLTYDSDDTTLTATVSKFNTPFVTSDKTYIYFLIVSYGHDFTTPHTMRICVGDIEKDFNIIDNVYFLRGSCDGVKFTYGQFINEFNLSHVGGDNVFENFAYVNAQVLACPDGECLASDTMFKTMYVPPTDMLTVNKSISFEGTKLKVRIPYNYHYYNSSMAVGIRQLRISISSKNFGPTGPYDYVLNGSSGEHLYYDYDSDFATDITNPFTLNTEVSGQHYYEIDLAKLDFVNELQSACGVRIYCNWGGSGANPDIILHPFGRKAEESYYTSDFAFSVTKLDSPKNLSYKSGILSWDSVAGACGYAVFDNDIYITSNTSDTSIDVSDVSAGEHTFRVRALGNVGKSLYESQAASVMTASMLNAYNANSNIVQLALLTYEINGDTITKFVPVGSKISGYIYDVNVPNKEFGGWYYDSGFSRKVESTDTIDGDIVIYARLTDMKVTERPLTWWEQHMWQVLIPIFVLVGVGIVTAVVVGIRKRKAA